MDYDKLEAAEKIALLRLALTFKNDWAGGNERKPTFEEYIRDLVDYAKKIAKES